MVVTFQIWGDFPVRKLRLNMSTSSGLALGPRLGEINWSRGAFGAHMKDGLVELLLSQGSAAAFSCSRGFQRGFQLSDAVSFLFIEVEAVDGCVFLHEVVGFTSVGCLTLV